MRLLASAKDRAVEVAQSHVSSLLGRLMYMALHDFEESGSEKFQISITVTGESKPGQEGELTLFAAGTTSVVLKQKDDTEPSVIYNEPTLFDGVEDAEGGEA